MNISGTGGTSYGASASGGFSGLVSGMDTEALVKKMLAGQQSKIDKQKAIKQTAEWKQKQYRDITKKINSFQSKYFDYTSKTALMSNSFFNQMKSVTSSSAFKVSGTSSAISGDMRVKIEQLASSTRLEGGKVAAADGLEMKFSPEELNKQVKFVIPAVKEIRKDADGKPVLDPDGKEIVDIVKDSAEVFLNNDDINNLLAGTTITRTFNTKADGTGTTESVVFSVKDGKFTADAGEREIHVNGAPSDGSTPTTSSAIGLATLGLTDGMKGSKVFPISTKVDENVKVSLEIALDGAKKTIEIGADELSTTVGKANLQKKLDFAFGTNTVTIDSGASGEDLTQGFKLKVGAGRKLQVVGGSTTGFAVGGVQNGQSNTVGAGDTVSNVFGYSKDDVFNVKINGKAIELKGTDTISDVMSKFNTSDADVKLEYDDYTNKFTLSRKSSGAGFDLQLEDDPTNAILSKIFGGKGSGDVASGQNAIVEINGEKTERASNTFTVSGLTFELLKETRDTSGALVEDTVTTTRNTEEIFNGLKSFVDDYNTMIKELNDIIDAKAEYKDYPPITDAQRKEMSQSEIDAWEKKAQVGLLKGDSDVSSFLSEMRLALFQKPENAKYGLYDLGIDTDKDWKKRGALIIDEAKLKEMINSDPTAIQDLFTFTKTKEVTIDGKKQTVSDGTQGIAAAFRNIIRQTANTSSGSPGRLVQIAGFENTGSDKKNSLFDTMQSATDRIKNLTNIYEKQKNRYWKQFSTMEQVLSQLSAQSGWLTQQTAG